MLSLLCFLAYVEYWYKNEQRLHCRDTFEGSVVSYPRKPSFFSCPKKKKATKVGLKRIVYILICVIAIHTTKYTLLFSIPVILYRIKKRFKGQDEVQETHFARSEELLQKFGVEMDEFAGAIILLLS